MPAAAPVAETPLVSLHVRLLNSTADVRSLLVLSRADTGGVVVGCFACLPACTAEHNKFVGAADAENSSRVGLILDAALCAAVTGKVFAPAVLALNVFGPNIS